MGKDRIKGIDTTPVNDIQPKGLKQYTDNYNDFTGNPVMGEGSNRVDIESKEGLAKYQANYGANTSIKQIDPYQQINDETQTNSGALNWSKTFLAKTLGKGVLGIGELAGYVVNPQDWGLGWNVSSPGNAISDFFRDKSKQIDENFKYNTEEGRLDMGDIGEGLAGVGSSAIQFLPIGFGVGGLIGRAFKGLKYADELALITQSVVINRAEAAQASISVYDKVYADKLNTFYNQDYLENLKKFNGDEVQAKAATKQSSEIKAKEAATNSYNTTSNLYALNMLFNATSNAKFLSGGTMLSRIERELTGRKLINELKSEAGQEFAEEFVSNIWEKAGESGKTLKDYFTANGLQSDAVKDMLSKESFEAGFWGAVGGVTNTVGQNAVNKYRKVTSSDGKRRSYNDEQNRLFHVWNDTKEEFKKMGQSPKSLLSIAGSQDDINSTYDKIQLAETNAALAHQNGLKDDVTKYEQEAKTLRSKLLDTQAYTAFETGTTKSLLNMYEGVVNLTEDDAKAQGLTVKRNANDNLHEDDYRERAVLAKKQILEAEKAYNVSQGYLNANSVYDTMRNISHLSGVIENAAKNLRPEILSNVKQAVESDKDLTDLLMNDDNSIIDLTSNVKRTQEQQDQVNTALSLSGGNVALRNYVQYNTEMEKVQNDLLEQRKKLAKQTSVQTQKSLVKQRTLINELNKVEDKTQVDEIVNKYKSANTTEDDIQFNKDIDQIATFVKSKLDDNQNKSSKADKVATKQRIATQNQTVNFNPTGEEVNLQADKPKNDSLVTFPTGESINTPQYQAQKTAVNDYIPLSEPEGTESQSTLADFEDNNLEGTTSIGSFFFGEEEIETPNTTTTNPNPQIVQQSPKLLEVLNRFHNRNTQASPLTASVDTAIEDLNNLKDLLAVLQEEGFDNPSLIDAGRILNSHIGNDGIAKVILERLFKVYTISNDVGMDFNKYWSIVNDKEFYEANEPDVNDDVIERETDRLIEQYFGYRESYPNTQNDQTKLAYLHQNFTVKDGKIINADLNPTYLHILNPKVLSVGTKIVVKAAPLDTTITVKGEKLPFDEFVIKRNLTPDRIEYQDNVPIGVYNENDDLFGYIHAVAFAFSPNKQGTRDYRKKIITALDNKSKSLKGTITSKQDGELLRVDKNSLANQNSQWKIATQKSNGFIDNEGNEIPSEQIYQNNFYPELGRIYDLRIIKYDNNNKPIYIALPIDQAKLDIEHIDMLVEAVRIYSTQDKSNPIVKQIKNTTTFDILESDGLEKFFNLYAASFKVSSTNRDASIADIASRHYKDNTPFITFANHRVTFGITNVKDAKGNHIYNSTSIGDKFLEKSLINLRKVLEQKKANIKLDAIPKGTIFKLVNGEVVTEDYKTYVGNSLQSNIQSINVGTEEEPVMATLVQPVIRFNIEYSNAKTVIETNETVIPFTVNEDNDVSTSIVDTETTTTFELTGDADLDALLAESINIPTSLTNASSDNTTFTQPSPKLITDFELELAEFEKDTRVEGITLGQQGQLIDYMVHTASFELNQNSNIEGSRLMDSFKKELAIRVDAAKLLNNMWLVQTAKLKEKLESLPALNGALQAKLNETNDTLNVLTKNQVMYNNLELESEQAKLFTAAFDKFVRVSKAKVSKNKQELKLDVIDATQDLTLEKGVDKIFEKQSYEENPATNINPKLRQFLSVIPKINSNGETVKGFLNVPIFVDFNDVFGVIKMLTANTTASFDNMISKLQDNVEVYPFLQTAIDRLLSADEDLKLQFTTSMSQSTLNMLFTGYRQSDRIDRETGEKYKVTSSKIFEANAYTKQRAIFDHWESNSFNSDLIDVFDGIYTINQERAKELISFYHNWYNRLKESNFFINKKLSDEQVVAEVTVFRQFLKEFGIDVHPRLATIIVTGNLVIAGKKVGYSNMFKSANITGTLLAQLIDSITETTKSKEDGTKVLTSVLQDGDSIISDKRVEFINSFVKLETVFNNSIVSHQFRIGEKQINGFINNHFAFDRVRELKESSILRDAYRNTAFAKNSLLLDMLAIDSFRESFELSILSPEAIKDFLNKSFGDMDIQSLSDIDHEISKISAFTEYRGNNTIKMNGEDYRIVKMYSPTMSDKSQMTLLQTAVKEMSETDLIEDGKIPNHTMDYIFNQTILGELMRFYTHTEGSNIKSYDEGAKNFYFWHQLNDLSVNGGNLKDVLNRYKDSVTPDDLVAQLKLDGVYQQIIDTIEPIIRNQAIKKADYWKETGIATKGIDSKYKTKRKGNVDLMAMDYVIASIIANVNYFHVLGGDPALYYKKGGNALDTAKKTFTNIGKRFGNQIASGTTLANAANNSYHQLFLKDPKSVAENINYLTELLDNKKFDKTTYESLTEKDKSDWVKTNYPNAAPYFDIDSADAQEFTTWKEHIYIIKQLGKIPNEDFEVYSDEDISTIEKLIESKIPFEQFNDGQKQLFARIMQPMKPVYTYMSPTPNGEVMRVQYIKSSSIPLIPQFTSGKEIDKLRLLLENIENKHGKTVRASFSTANKVGDVANPLDIWTTDKQGNVTGIQDLSELNIDDLLGTSVLSLNRSGFRIQQSIPFKSAKNKQDSISMGTQTTKILFSDIRDIDGFKFGDNDNLTGSQLELIYNDTYNKLYTALKNKFLKEIGVSDNMVIADKDKFIQKLNDLLKDEAITREFGLSDIEALDIVTDANGNKQFKVPLWLSNSAERYENLINSIINNRIIKIKFNGYSYVVASEEGIQIKDARTISEVNADKIIYTDKWNGKKLKSNQVFVPSKLRDKSGQLLDLFKDFNELINEGKYIIRTDKGYRLKTEMFDAELLEMFTFRIPTSGKMSMSSVEIAGFLPQVMGDVMFGSKNLTKQKGLDYDVDKEYAYSLSQRVKHGRVVVDESDEIKRLTNKIIRIHHAILKNKKVNKQNFQPLGFDIATESSSFIENSRNNSNGNSDFVPLSDEYQKNKLISGAAGKMMTGISSLAVTSHSQFQRLHHVETEDSKGNTITPVMRLYERIDAFNSQALSIQFGNIKTNAVLGNTYTLSAATIKANNYKEQLQILLNKKKDEDTFQELLTNAKKAEDFSIEPTKKRPNYDEAIAELRKKISSLNVDNVRTITEVLAEWQNFSVDNEKEQILGKINLNGVTSNAFSVLILSGFDLEYSKKYDKKLSIPNTFLSLPILVKYANIKANQESIISEYTPDAEKYSALTAMKQMFGDNLSAAALELLNIGWDNVEYSNANLDNKLSVENMMSVIDSSYTDTDVQMLMAHALVKFKQLTNAGQAIQNLQSLVNVDSKGLKGTLVESMIKQEKLNKIKDENKINFDNVTITNTFHLLNDSVIGSAADNGLSPVRLFTNDKNLFPLQDFENLFKLIPNALGNTVSRTAQKVELKQTILQEFRKAANVHVLNSVFNTRRNVNKSIDELRFELFTSVKVGGQLVHESLAMYLQKIKRLGVSNSLINALDTNLSNPDYHVIRFNNTNTNNDEIRLYNAMTQMMIENKKLPSFNGEDFTTKDLAEALIQYSFLNGNVQEAIEFTKFIPINYLELMGVNEALRNLDINQVMLDTNFVTQFVQHNADLVKNKLSKADMSNSQFKATAKYKDNEVDKGKVPMTLQSFQWNTGVPIEDRPAFMTIKSGTSKPTHCLFQLDRNGVYQRISTLGAFGLSEYTVTDNKQSIIKSNNAYDNNTVTEQQKTAVRDSKTKDLYKDVNTALATIISNDSYLSAVAQEIVGLSDYRIIFSDNPTSQGLTNSTDKTITIWSELLKDIDKLENVLMEEILHSVSMEAIRKVFNNVTGEQRAVLTPIQRQVQGLYKRTQEELEKVYGKGIIEKLSKFMYLNKHKLPTEKMLFGEDTKRTMNDVRILYSVTDMSEFVARTLSHKATMQKLSEINFTSKQTLLQRLADVVMNTLKKLGIVRENSLLEATMLANLNFIREANKQVTYSPLTFEYNDGKSKDQISSGQKTSTTRTKELTGLTVGESSIQFVDGEAVRITYHGELTNNEAEKVLGKSLSSERKDTIKQEMKDYLNGVGKRHVYSIKLANPVSFLNKLKNENSNRFNNKEVKFVDPKNTDMEGSIGLTNDKKFYFINEGMLTERFNKRVWEQSASKSTNGIASTMNPIETNQFNTITDYTQFLMFRLDYQSNSNKTWGDNQNDANAYGLKKLIEFKYGKDVEVIDVSNNFSIDDTQDNLARHPIEFRIDAVDILSSSKADKVFEKGLKNNWTLDKILNELQVPKSQKELINNVGRTMPIFDEIPLNQQIAFEVANSYMFSVKTELSTTVERKVINHYDGSEEGRREELIYNKPTDHHVNLTVKGGIDYEENEIQTPNIVPNIKGHAEFSSNKGIGWFRSDTVGTKTGNTVFNPNSILSYDFANMTDDEIGEVYLSGNYKDTESFKDVLKETKIRRILELQSDLFQKGRDKNDLVNIDADSDEFGVGTLETGEFFVGTPNGVIIKKFKTKEEAINEARRLVTLPKIEKENQFLQLLNKDGNWVSFFIKTIIQDSVKNGFEKVRFPSGNTASKVEGHETLEEFKKQKEGRIKQLEITLSNDYKPFNSLYTKLEYDPISNTDVTQYIELSIDGYGEYDYEYLTKEEYELRMNKSIDNHKKETIREINQLKQELANIENEGLAALKPIYTFYESKVTNILKKLGTVTQVTDEYGNTWNELDLNDMKLRDKTDLILMENTTGISTDIMTFRNSLSAEDKQLFIKLQSQNNIKTKCG